MLQCIGHGKILLDVIVQFVRILQMDQEYVWDFHCGIQTEKSRL